MLFEIHHRTHWIEICIKLYPIQSAKKAVRNHGLKVTGFFGFRFGFSGKDRHPLLAFKYPLYGGFGGFRRHIPYGPYGVRANECPLHRTPGDPPGAGGWARLRPPRRGGVPAMGSVALSQHFVSENNNRIFLIFAMIQSHQPYEMQIISFANLRVVFERFNICIFFRIQILFCRCDLENNLFFCSNIPAPANCLPCRSFHVTTRAGFIPHRDLFGFGLFSI